MHALQPETTDRELVHDSEYISVWCHPSLRLIHHQMHKVCYGEPFRAALTAGTVAMKRHGATAWLSDDRLNGPVPDPDERWATTKWFPQTHAAGWRYWAMVLPARAVGKLNVKRYVEMYRKLGVEAQMFADPAPALEWVRQQQLRSAR